MSPDPGRPRFSNPAAVHPPLGPYSHCVSVPAGSELVVFAGQIGNRTDGTWAADIRGQAEQAFANVVELLRANELEIRDCIKLTVFLAPGVDAAAVKAARLAHFGAHEPASTTLYVAGLLNPEWLIEVEAMAVRAAVP